MFEFFEAIAKSALIVACLYLTLAIYVRRRLPSWSEPLQQRRFAILALLVFAVTAFAIGEDVIGHETTPVDTAILMFLHAHVPAAMLGFFGAVTLSGSSTVIVPLAVLGAVGLLFARRRKEALLLGSSVGSAALVIYVVKTLVARERPSLWDTDWYWGSSFPSGHTLAVAAFSTALAVCVMRIWPRTRLWPLAGSFAWTTLVGLSRLVLGVHWPTDVLVAACIGAFLPLLMSVGLDLRRA